jgi:hypothetical protein
MAGSALDNSHKERALAHPSRDQWNPLMQARNAIMQSDSIQLAQPSAASQEPNASESWIKRMKMCAADRLRGKKYCIVSPLSWIWGLCWLGEKQILCEQELKRHTITSVHG